MQRLMKICARGALGLGAAALLLSGIPAHANAGAASPESQPRLMAQSKAQPGEAEQLEKAPQKAIAPPPAPPPQAQPAPKRARMRGAMPEVDSSKSSKSKFGAGVIRKSEKPVDSE
jgi:hypothetical protein